MRAEIKRLHSPDVYDLNAWDPPDKLNAGALIQVMASPRGEGGEESFDLVVGTTVYLHNHELADDPFVIVVERWDFALIRGMLRRLFETPEADNWEQLGDILGKIGAWEFTDYRPYVPDDPHPDTS